MDAVRKRQTTVYIFSFFCFGLILSIIGIALPFLAEHTGVTLSRISLIFTMSSIGFMIGSLVGGRLYDRIRGTLLLGFGWCLSAAVAFVIPVITSFPVLCAAIFLFGFANSTIVVGCNTMITRVDRERTEFLLNGMHLMNGVGAFLTPLLFTWVINRTGDVVLGYRMYSVLFIGAAVFSFTTPEPPRDGSIQAGNGESREGHSQGGSRFLLAVLVATILIYVGAEISFNGWIFSYIRAMFPHTGDQAGLVTSAFWGCMTLGRLTAIFQLKRMPPKQLLVWNFTGIGIGLAVIVLGSQQLFMVWAGTLLTGYSMGAVFPLMMAYGDNAIGLSGKVAGIIFAGTSIGGMIFPFLSGQLFTRYSPNATILLMLVNVMISSALFLLLRSVAVKALDKPR